MNVREWLEWVLDQAKESAWALVCIGMYVLIFLFLTVLIRFVWLLLWVEVK